MYFEIDQLVFLSNIFSTLDNKKPLPVIVFFHGLAYVSGSSSSALGADYLMDSPHPTVIVAANYRLGPLGWLSAEDAVLHGNLGLLDQAAALAWVRRHVAAFGGDPDAVTVAGHGAGASSVGLMLSSPAFNGLFARAVSLSGPVLDSPLMRHGDAPSYYTSAYVAEVGCDEATDSQEIVKCLQVRNTTCQVYLRTVQPSESEIVR